ncbi:MAG: hypothetical protein P8I34_01370 [Flavobacteriaceae bacterium]|nr:hypothetical protein [Flavobacteriaceae bacterium]
MKKSDYLILTAAFVSFLFSVYLWFEGQQQEGLYVSIWVPSILAAGGYIKQMSK